VDQGGQLRALAVATIVLAAPFLTSDAAAFITGADLASTGNDRLSRTAGRIPIAVTLIGREPAYVWKPMLHTIAAGTSDFSQQET
jgi:hypothetical protein